MISIDSTKCTKCGFCIDECPNFVFTSTSTAGDGQEIEVQYPEHYCICGHCIAICPRSAITHEEIPNNEFEDLLNAKIPPEDMRTILLSRRSIRAFSDKPVSQELVGQLIEMGVHAGTASNGQTESFIIIQDRKVLTELEHIVINVLWKAGLRYMGSGIGSRIARMKLGDEMTRQAVTYYHIIKNRRKDNQLAGMIFRNAPVVIVCHGLRTYHMAHANCATAARNMEIMAKAMGLGTCWVGFLSVAAHFSKKIAGYLGIPADHNVYSAIMVGFPKHEYKKKIPRKDREVRWMWNAKG